MHTGIQPRTRLPCRGKPKANELQTKVIQTVSVLTNYIQSHLALQRAVVGLKDIIVPWVANGSKLFPYRKKTMKKPTDCFCWQGAGRLAVHGLIPKIAARWDPFHCSTLFD